MRAALDMIGYHLLNDAQRAEVIAYMAALDRPIDRYAIVHLEATGEGTVRVERYLYGWPMEQSVADVYDACPAGRGRYELLRMRETLRAPVPPPWLQWPDPRKDPAWPSTTTTN